MACGISRLSEATTETATWVTSAAHGFPLWVNRYHFRHADLFPDPVISDSSTIDHAQSRLTTPRNVGEA